MHGGVINLSLNSLFQFRNIVFPVVQWHVSGKLQVSELVYFLYTAKGLKKIRLLLIYMSVSSFLHVAIMFKTRICPIIQPRRINVTHLNFQAQQPDGNLAFIIFVCLFVFVFATHFYRSLDFMFTQSEYGSLCFWGSSPFLKYKGTWGIRALSDGTNESQQDNKSSLTGCISYLSMQ